MAGKSPSAASKCPPMNLVNSSQGPWQFPFSSSLPWVFRLKLSSDVSAIQPVEELCLSCMLSFIEGGYLAHFFEDCCVSWEAERGQSWRATPLAPACFSVDPFIAVCGDPLPVAMCWMPVPEELRAGWMWVSRTHHRGDDQSPGLKVEE